MKYSIDDMAVIIPTRNRPDKIFNLLESFLEQEFTPKTIIIIASGESIKNVINKFEKELNIEYFHTNLEGQLIQRAIGIDKIEDSIRLVCFFDDDIVLEKDALKNMISFWNNIESETAGVSFNVYNNPDHRCSLIQRLLLHSVPEKGKVLKSGMSTPSSPTLIDLKVQWLCGGATVWKNSILKQFPQNQIKTKWAIAEDLIYSYPVGKKYPLYVSSESRVRHEHHSDYAVSNRAYYHGKTQTLWTLFFVVSNPDLSKMLFTFVTITKIFAKMIRGIIFLNMEDVDFSRGQIRGLTIGLISLMKSEDLKRLIAEED